MKTDANMKKYTYSRGNLAHYGQTQVTVPDQVADNQHAYDGMTFTAIRSNGLKVRVRLRGDLYGLHTPGTGDMVVTSA